MTRSHSAKPRHHHQQDGQLCSHQSVHMGISSGCNLAPCSDWKLLHRSGAHFRQFSGRTNAEGDYRTDRAQAKHDDRHRCRDDADELTRGFHRKLSKSPSYWLHWNQLGVRVAGGKSHFNPRVIDQNSILMWCLSDGYNWAE